MPSTGTADGKRLQRARIDAAAGGLPLNTRLPVSSIPFTEENMPLIIARAGPGYVADRFEQRDFDHIFSIAEHVGDLEAMIGAGSTTTGGGFTVQLHLVRGSAPRALDLVQRSTGGVLFLKAYMVPFSAYYEQTTSEQTDTSDAPDEWSTGSD